MTADDVRAAAGGRWPGILSVPRLLGFDPHRSGAIR